MPPVLGPPLRRSPLPPGGCEADNQTIRFAAALEARKGKRHIISTALGHHAVLHTLKKLEGEDLEVELLPVGKLGTVTAQQAAELSGRTLP